MCHTVRALGHRGSESTCGRVLDLTMGLLPVGKRLRTVLVQGTRMLGSCNPALRVPYLGADGPL